MIYGRKIFSKLFNAIFRFHCAQMFIFNTPEIIFMLSSKRWRLLASAMSHVHEILDKKTYLCNSNHKKQYSNDVTNLEMKILTRWSKV